MVTITRRRKSAANEFGWLVVLCLLVCSSGQAHLLNMTEAIAEIDQSGHISVTIQLDLLAELGSAEAYFSASLSDSQQAPEAEMFKKLEGAIEAYQEDSRIDLRVTNVQWPAGYDLGDYKSQIVWPKTTVKLTGQLNSKAPLAIRFTSAFIFEEPVALTIRSSVTGKRKSRWLVAGQTSPRFDPGNLEIEATDISLEGVVRQGADFAAHGFRHIVIGGWDHLLFLLALCLSARSAWQLIIRISLFTLAHTLTLAMASYRLIELNAYWLNSRLSDLSFWWRSLACGKFTVPGILCAIVILSSPQGCLTPPQSGYSYLDCCTAWVLLPACRLSRYPPTSS